MGRPVVSRPQQGSMKVQLDRYKQARYVRILVPWTAPRQKVTLEVRDAQRCTFNTTPATMTPAFCTWKVETLKEQFLTWNLALPLLLVMIHLILIDASIQALESIEVPGMGESRSSGGSGRLGTKDAISDHLVMGGGES